MKRLCEALASRTLTFAVLTVTLALGGLAAPLAAGAQGPTKVWRIGLFHVGLDHVPPSLAPLREGLKALGYEEGKNLRLDWRNLPDEKAARETAKEFVYRPRFRGHRVDGNRSCWGVPEIWPRCRSSIVGPLRDRGFDALAGRTAGAA